jgi:hypothetical protein
MADAEESPEVPPAEPGPEQAQAESEPDPEPDAPRSAAATDGPPHEILQSLLDQKEVTRSVEALFGSLEQYGSAGAAQTELQATMVRDLMRCVGENHKCIQVQTDALGDNRAEIAQLQQQLVALTSRVDQAPAAAAPAAAAPAAVGYDDAGLQNQLQELLAVGGKIIFHATLFVLYDQSLMKYTEARGNDVIVHGYCYRNSAKPCVTACTGSRRPRLPTTALWDRTWSRTCGSSSASWPGSPSSSGSRPVPGRFPRIPSFSASPMNQPLALYPLCKILGARGQAAGG